MQQDATTIYERLGGEAAVRRLVKSFYRHMDELAETKKIRQMHARSLKGSEEKLFMFLSGWLGGPGLYIERYGHPRLRMRHLPFAIDEAARDQWLLCMRLALDETVDDRELRDELMAAFFGIADFMRNQPAD